jgi:hypothetical protein
MRHHTCFIYACKSLNCLTSNTRSLLILGNFKTSTKTFIRHFFVSFSWRTIAKIAISYIHDPRITKFFKPDNFITVDNLYVPPKFLLTLKFLPITVVGNVNRYSSFCYANARGILNHMSCSTSAFMALIVCTVCITFHCITSFSYK